MAMELNGNTVGGKEHKPELATLSRQLSFTAAQKQKAIAIFDRCRWKDIDALRALATSEGGLISDELRCLACKYTLFPLQPVLRLHSIAGPLLLGIVENAEDEKDGSPDTRPWRSLPPHRDEDQVRLDVDRSFIYYPDSTSHNTSVTRVGY
jgi:TBC1 domain family member 20